jgi:hypothetical protein
MIVASILWRRLDAPGHDACRVERDGFGWRLEGTAVFLLGGEPANLSYRVSCDAGWKTASGRVHGAIGERPVEHFVAREEGRWRLDGEAVAGLDHVEDLDLSFTPATNLLQIKRADLPIGKAVRLPAAWLNVETGALTALEQIYERRSEGAFYYCAPELGYEGLLELAPNGFVRRYPGLWEAEPPGA